MIVIVCWLVVLGIGGHLRFDDLAGRPCHFDEATGARITAKRMESDDYRFDPTHYHGPLLSGLAIPVCGAREEAKWSAMSKWTLRLVPAIAGLLVVLAPVFGRRRWGDGPTLLAGAFLATSPLLVYYSRMFIHESLLVLFGMLAVMALLLKPRAAILGVLVGLMFATKETFAISVIAWSAAGVLLLLENRRRLERQWWKKAWFDYRAPVGLALLAAIATAVAIYSGGFRDFRGVVDAVRTFFVYQTTEGHDKPLPYYFELLLKPRVLGGRWWFETPVMVLAVLAYGMSFTRGKMADGTRWAIRFLAYAVVGHFLIYSLIGYKTPWLICLPWAQVCLLAGFGVAVVASRPWPMKGLVWVVAVLALGSQFHQARQATGRMESDDRNPYAYVPTSEDIEGLVPWLREIDAASPDVKMEPVGVIGSGHWPLPWYLRSFELTGFWAEPPDQLERLPLVFAMPDATDAVIAVLGDTHMMVPRGLRFEVPLMVFVRNDLWSAWMEAGTANGGEE